MDHVKDEIIVVFDVADILVNCIVILSDCFKQLIEIIFVTMVEIVDSLVI